MNLVFETIEKCSKDNSKNNKLAYLQEQVHNEDLKEFLRTVYEPRINFYMKKVDPTFQVSSLFIEDETTFSREILGDIVKKISHREITGHTAKSYITSLYHSFNNPNDKILLEMLIQRDCRAGFSASTINKVWPGLVTDVPYMRCSLATDLKKTNKLDHWDWADGVISQVKADGMFATMSHRPNGQVSIFSRNGSPFPLDEFSSIKKELIEHIPEGWQIHGELLVKRNGKVLARQLGNGILNHVLQGGQFDSGDVPVFHAWDMIPNVSAVSKGSYEVPYGERLQKLESHLIDSINIEVIEYKVVHSLKDAYAHCKEMMQLGLEGTVIKRKTMFWEDKDSKGQVKLKLTFDVDLMMVKLNPADHKSKNIDTFGSILCTSSDGLLEVSVTGIPDDMRQRIFDNWDLEYKDRIMSVSSNGIMEPRESNEKYSLFLPRRNAKILEMPRLDKNVADSLQRIIQIQQNTIDMVDELS